MTSAVPSTDPVFSELTERACIGPCLMADPANALRAWLTVREHCPTAEYFFVRTHRLIALAMNQLSDDGQPFGAEQVIQRMAETRFHDAMDLLAGRGKWKREPGIDYGATVLAEVGGAFVVAELSDFGHLTSIAANAKTVAQYYRTRQALEIIAKAKDQLHAPAGARGLAATISAIIGDLCKLGGESSDRSLGDCARASLAQHDAIQSRQGAPTALGSWGLPKLDELVPLKGGRFIVLAAPPKRGKTTLAINLTLASAKALGPDAVAYLSLEMMGEDLANQVIGRELGLPSSTVENGELLPDQREAAERIREGLDDKRVFIRDTIGDTTAGMLAAWIRRLHLRSQGRLAVVVIDYLQLLAKDNDRQHETGKLSEATRSLKVLAASLSICVVALSQFNRDSTKQGRDKAGNLSTNAEPQVADLRGSGTIEQDCDAAVLLWPRRQAGGTSLTTAKVAINRRGPEANVDLEFQFARGGSVREVGDMPESPADIAARGHRYESQPTDTEDLFNR